MESNAFTLLLLYDKNLLLLDMTLMYSHLGRRRPRAEDTGGK